MQQTKDTNSPKSRNNLRLCVLGSGSGGNSAVLQLGSAAILIDAGLGPRTTASRLRGAKLDLTNLSAICVTHLDSDHFRPNWVPILIALRIPLLLHRWHLAVLKRLNGADELERQQLVQVFDDKPFEPIPTLRVTAVPLPHDVKGTTGFHFESDAGRVGYATDLGHVPAQLITRFAGVDLLAIESNYDPQMQLGSTRPLFLKRRIMGGRGHLSNQESFEAVRRIVDRSPIGRPQRIVLLHRSRQCNCPYVVSRVFDQDPRIGPRIVLTEQRRRTRWLTVTPPPPLHRHQLNWAF
ncbi:MAG: MBL fold metallo-hydrolase [Phycisphaeraceae bacterium]